MTPAAPASPLGSLPYRPFGPYHTCTPYLFCIPGVPPHTNPVYPCQTSGLGQKDIKMDKRGEERDPERGPERGRKYREERRRRAFWINAEHIKAKGRGGQERSSGSHDMGSSLLAFPWFGQSRQRLQVCNRMQKLGGVLHSLRFIDLCYWICSWNFMVKVPIGFSKCSSNGVNLSQSLSVLHCRTKIKWQTNSRRCFCCQRVVSQVCLGDLLRRKCSVW